MIGLLCHVCSADDAAAFADSGLHLCESCRETENALCSYTLRHRWRTTDDGTAPTFPLTERLHRRRLAAWQRGPRPTHQQLHEGG